MIPRGDRPSPTEVTAETQGPPLRYFSESYMYGRGLTRPLCTGQNAKIDFPAAFLAAVLRLSDGLTRRTLPRVQTRRF